GNGDALAFTAGKRLSPFADHRIVAVRKLQDEIMRAGGAGGSDNFTSRGVRFAIGDVFGERAVKQKRILENDANVGAVFGNRVGTDIDAVGENRAFGDIEEPADQIN